MKCSYQLLFTLLFCPFFIKAQAVLNFKNTPVFENGKQLKFPFVGGIASPQFSDIDVNNDGIKDLFVFDKDGYFNTVFINSGAANTIDYQYAPSFSNNFPELVEWAILRDYNCDGIEDIFTFNKTENVAGITVYKGFYNTSNEIEFELVKDLLEFPGNLGFPTNIYVANYDIPDVNDIDGDGDLDIVTFAFSGGYVELYKNNSVENGFGCDSLDFDLSDNCWGRFYESGLSPTIELSPSPDSCMNGFTAGPIVRHAGSTVLTLDMDGDDDLDLMLGDISFTQINMLTNNGTSENAHFTAQVPDFPAGNDMINIEIFPAAFHVDVNNDGKRDLIAAPNQLNASQNINTCWYYENSGTDNNPDFQLNTKQFLEDDMIDLGGYSRPTLFDYNGDGFDDLLIGNFGFTDLPGLSQESRFVLYERSGGLHAPVFTKVNDAYLFNLISGYQSMMPTAGDLDNDGDTDLVFGDRSGKIFWLENEAGPGLAPQFSSLQTVTIENVQIDVGQSATPQLIDLNRDGKVDLVCGHKQGTLFYFENTGLSGTFELTMQSNALGAVSTKAPGSISGYSAPYFYEVDEEYHLICGSESRQMLKYGNIEGNLAGDFDLQVEQWGAINKGNFMQVLIVDIDHDYALDAIVSNNRGGIQFYTSNILTNVGAMQAEVFDFSLSPSPTTSGFNIHSSTAFPESAKLEVYDISGRMILTKMNIQDNSFIETSNWLSGTYIIKIICNGKVGAQKLVVY